MGKKILIWKGSARKNGNSDMLADALAGGALSAGHEVVCIRLSDMNIKGCRACNGCWNSQGNCVFRDDMEKLQEELESADVLVVAAPLYWSMVPAQVKAPIDRLYQYDPNHGGVRMHVKESVLLACGETDNEADFDMVRSFFTMVSEFNGMQVRGIIAVPNVNYKGDIEGNEALDRAKELGAAL